MHVYKDECFDWYECNIYMNSCRQFLQVLQNKKVSETKLFSTYYSKQHDVVFLDKY